jgi:hypothetical protein
MPGVNVIVISGSMGSGKTTVLGEASDVLSAASIPHAAIDLDSIATALLPVDRSRELADRNLAALYANMTAAGITYLLLAEAVEDAPALDRLRAAMPRSSVIVCRLIASVPTMQERLRLREPGMLQAQFLARSAELELILQRAALEAFTVANDGRSVTDVAREMLQRAGWISDLRA